MKTVLTLTALFLLMGCGATADPHLVTLADVDTGLAQRHGPDVRWIDLADQRGDYDRDEVSRADSTTTWVNLCDADCAYFERAYSSTFEDIAQTLFVAEQLAAIGERPDRARFGRLARVADQFVTADRLRTLQRRLEYLNPKRDFPDRPALQAAASEGLRHARRQFERVRGRVDQSQALIAKIAPPIQIVQPVRPTPLSESNRAWATALNE